MAWPHRDNVAETSITVALDIIVLVFLTGFLYWSLIIAPGTAPEQSPLALRMLAIIGPLVRLSAVIGLVLAARSAGKGPWAAVYQRMAIGLGLAFLLLVFLGFVTVSGNYGTGAIPDIGWMLPFFFAASAVAIAPPSPVLQRTAVPWSTRHSSPALLFAALLTVTVVGYSSRYLMPLGPPVDDFRELATAFTLICGGAIVMVRLRVEQRAVEQANQRVRLLATACEQAGELIVIIGPDGRIEYANDAFCRASGYSHEELDSLPPNRLAAPESCGEIPAIVERLRAREQVRISVALARKDGSTFNAACAAAPIVDDTGRVTHFVGVIRDVTEELRLREQLVRGERLSAVGEFVSGVAHEINNPLQSVIGTLELVLSQTHDADVRVDLERARFEAGRAGRIVRNLLTFVRHSSKERLLMDLNEIVKSTMGVRAFELEMSGITTREEYAPVLPLVLANREEIQQVILHLVINAQQAMTGIEAAARALGADAARRQRCDPRGRRHRSGRSGRSRRPHLRAVLHDQDDRRRRRPWPVAVAGDRERPPRHARPRADRNRQLLPPHASRRRLSRARIRSLISRSSCPPSGGRCGLTVEAGHYVSERHRV